MRIIQDYVVNEQTSTITEGRKIRFHHSAGLKFVGQRSPVGIYVSVWNYKVPFICKWVFIVTVNGTRLD